MICFFCPTLFYTNQIFSENDVWYVINKCLVYKNVQIDKIKHRLKDHVLSVHSGQGVKNWCHICDKYYRTKNSLNKHMCVYHNKKSFMGIQL